MQRRSFKTPNQLKRSVYAYIMLFFLAFLAAFVLLGNLGRIVQSRNSQTVQAQEAQARAVLARRAQEGAAPQAGVPAGADPAAAVGLLGGDACLQPLKVQLGLLGQAWRQVEAGASDAPELIIVSGAGLDAGQLAWLAEQNAAGARLLFVDLPTPQLLSRGETLALLGIESLGERQTYPGARAGRELLLGAALEYDGGKPGQDGGEALSLEVEAYAVRLAREVKVYAHALPQDHARQSVTELPPLFWRYAPGGGRGAVYVCNGSFFADETAYALLPTVLGGGSGGFLYPIVNAYCLMIDGFPYADNQTRALWQRLYSRDGYGIQRDILLPEWERMQNLYGTAITYFSPVYEQTQTGPDVEMLFYRAQFQQGNAELAGKSGDHCYLFSPGEPFALVPWTADFSFEKEGALRLPFQAGAWITPQKNRFRTAGMIRGLGFLGLRISVPTLLDIQTGEGLPAFFERAESVLAEHARDYPWLSRTTAREAVARLDAYLRLSPSYEYRRDGVTVRAQGFEGQAWFVLRTHGANPQIQGGTICAIGQDTYLVELSAPTAHITWDGEDT